MAFRGHDSREPNLVRDPYARFVALDAAFESRRGLLGDQAPQRLAAIGLALSDEDPNLLAEDVAALAEALGDALPWYTTVSPQLRMVLGAVLRRRGDRVDELAAESQRVGELMRKHGMRWAPMQSLISVLTLRMHLERAAIPDELVERMSEVWDAMRKHHPWLTGADDWPLCALLATRPGSPAELALRAHEVYEALRERAGGRRGQSLQSASNLLALVEARPTQLADRYAELRAGFESVGISVSYDTYEDVASLCLLPRKAASVVEIVDDYYARMCDHMRWHERFYAFQCASNLALVHASQSDVQLRPIVDLKLLLDMQTILAQRG